MENSQEVQQPLLYKKLYHASVERCESLQQKIDQLLSKHKKIAELKDKVMSSLTKNKELMDYYHESLALRETELQTKIEGCHSREKKWKEEYGELQEKYHVKTQECEELRTMCGRLIARTALARAENTATEQVIKEIKLRKKMEAEKMKKTFSKYSQSLMRKHTEVKESLEFSEAERAALLDSNTELESQLKTVRSELDQSHCALKKAESELSERRTRSPHPLHLPDNLPPSSCHACQALSRQLRLAIDALKDKGCAKYDDLLHSNFLLQQKVTSMELKLMEEMQNYQKSVEYIQEYKARSIEKVNILKENIKKADAEIAELDKLIDMTREAMHTSMDLVRQSPHLTKVLIELDGTNMIE